MIVNLLEVVMYYDYAVEAMGDCLVDLLDYICRRVVRLAARGVRGMTSAPAESKTAKQVYEDIQKSSPGEVRTATRGLLCGASHAPSRPVRSAVRVCVLLFGAGAAAAHQDLQRRCDDLMFKSGVVSVSLLRYLTEHVSKLPLSVMTRMLETHGA